MSKRDNDRLVIGITTTALFNMSESDRFFREALAEDRTTALMRYREHVQALEDEPLESGTGYPLVEALLGLNRYAPSDVPLVEVVVMSRNSHETGVRVFNSIRERKLDITRAAFTNGTSVTRYLQAFGVDLFLTTNPHDAQQVIDSGVCAAALVCPPPVENPPCEAGQVRIAFDADAVLFSDESEQLYKREGLGAFLNHEDALRDQPLADGPYARLLRKLAALQQKLPVDEPPPLRTALVTARSMPAALRVINTLRHWGVQIDETFFMGGLDKAGILEAFAPQIFFDDQERHLQEASRRVPAGRVPWQSDSPLNATVDVPGQADDADTPENRSNEEQPV